jgi:hypothetical protein
MTTRRAAIVEGALLSKGFVTDNGKHIELRLYVDGQRTGVATHLSHNSPQLDDFLLGMMARQVRLPKDAFLDLVDCTLSGNDYADRMVSEGHAVLRATAPTSAATKREPKKKPGSGSRKKRR